MKKKIFLIITILICIITVGCSSSSDDNSASKNNNYSFDDLKNELTALDSSIDVIHKEASYVGGIEGYGYLVNGCKIEVYKFDKNSSEYKTAESNQKLTMPLFNNMTFDATVKNGYAYIITDGNCDSIKPIVEKIMK